MSGASRREAACPAESRKTRVIVCDDSLVVRNAMARILCAEADIETLPSTSNGAAVVEAVRQAHGDTPIDVVVLDIEMPVMDGLEALPLLLRIDPGLRVIVVSTLSTRGGSVAMKALELGAVDYVTKPAGGLQSSKAFATELLGKIRAVAHQQSRVAAPVGRPPRATPTSPQVARRAPSPATRPSVVAIGCSTGGPAALLAVVKALRQPLPLPVVVTQHMPPPFILPFAESVAALGVMPCTVARDAEPVMPGRILIAPGDRHLCLERVEKHLVTRLSDAPPENYCRPAVDVMLRSVAQVCGGGALVVMLTGMGRDGLDGTREVVRLGGVALAQDKATSVVWGMPGAIADAGLADEVLPLDQLAGAIQARVGRS